MGGGCGSRYKNEFMILSSCSLESDILATRTWFQLIISGLFILDIKVLSLYF